MILLRSIEELQSLYTKYLNDLEAKGVDTTDRTKTETFEQFVAAQKIEDRTLAKDYGGAALVIAAGLIVFKKIFLRR